MVDDGGVSTAFWRLRQKPEPEATPEDPGLWFRTARRGWGRKAFNAMDTDGDGTLDVMELYAAVLLWVAKVNDTPLSLDPPSLETIKAMFQRADLDKDGQLDFEEFDTMLADILLRNLGLRLLLKTGAKLVVAPLLAFALLRRLESRLAKDNWLARALARRIGLIICTVVLAAFIVPLLTPFLDTATEETMRLRRALLRRRRGFHFPWQQDLRPALAGLY